MWYIWVWYWVEEQWWGEARPHFCGCFNYRLIGSPTGGGRRYVIKYGSPGGRGGFLIANPGLDEGHKYCH